MKFCRFFTGACWLLFIAIFSGCASTSEQSAFIPLIQSQQNRIYSAEVHIFASQGAVYKDISMSTNVSTITGGGLIPALIDSAIHDANNQESDEKLDTITEAADDVYFGQLLKTQIAIELNNIEWLKLTDTPLHPGEPQIKPENILKSAEAPNVLFINATYNFTADFKMLVIRSKLALFPSLSNPKYASSNSEAKHLAHFDNCIYKNNYLFT